MNLRIASKILVAFEATPVLEGKVTMSHQL
jgi:hypothetical protein